MKYVGRFAPSPSGDLHFGSLIAALGSYLQAKASAGEWLVRIEDIDPPREVPGAASRILRTLEAYGLFWDRDVTYQSTRHSYYRHVLDLLTQQHLTYFCACKRHDIQQRGGHRRADCDRRIQSTAASPAAIRFYQTHPVNHVHDLHYGDVLVPALLAEEDFILRRKDGLIAYNLAVVVDDHEQGITDIVRGGDLLETTVWHIALYQQMQWPVPTYLHLPLARDKQGHKLSKQNHAPALPKQNSVATLADALRFLNQPLPDDWQDASPETLLSYAVSHWDSSRLLLTHR